MENILELKTINELQEYKFYIPSYQRGYRWSSKEVIDLLNDISEFIPKQVGDTDQKTWYCLQPIVIKKKDDGQYEVIDGQQRLTSIYLVLHYLNQDFVEARREKLYELDYETRLNSKQFLKELDANVIREEYVDFFYISTAYKTISDWFESKPNNFDKADFGSKFKFHSKVIWYQCIESDPIAIFTRINIGKIPLTNAELIKALFLNSSNFDKSNFDKIRLKQLEISTEWDMIEQALQKNKFWYFLTGNKTSTNRIEFIFNLMNTEIDKSDNYSTFRYFNSKFQNKNQKTIEINWSEIKQHFQRFDEWFNKRDWYHKIGYLICIDAITIKDLYDKSVLFTKTEFADFLNKSIKNSLKNISLEELQYGGDNKDVKRILLLYNIATMLKNENENSYFPFDVYREKKWDIEHITSVTDTIPTDKEKWLADAKVYFEIEKEPGEKLLNRANACNCSDDKEFETLFKDIVNYFNSELRDQDINDISNLALLDSETNRGYKNAVFPFKRNTIIEKDKAGSFVPIGTKNVFLKYFSNYPPKISFWTQDDRDKYFDDLELVLNEYLD